MKITIDTKDNEIIKIAGKPVEEVSKDKKEQVATAIKNFLMKYTTLTDYETDCMWMSYRYCIGRHTIASHMHANDIWKHCKGRMSKDKELFNAFDINREIEQYLGFIKPDFYFPITSLNRIYTSALDIVFEFIEDHNIQSKEEFIKYKDVHIILADNERGYKIETVTWDEWLRPNVIDIVQKYMNVTSDEAWEIFERWRNTGTCFDDLKKEFKNLTKNMPNPETYWMSDIEDLMIWNDLVHCFDHEHHHKSILKDGSECIWFWSWAKKYNKDGYVIFGYERIRVPLDKWNGYMTTWIPDELIKENLY